MGVGGVVQRQRRSGDGGAELSRHILVSCRTESYLHIEHPNGRNMKLKNTVENKAKKQAPKFERV